MEKQFRSYWNNMKVLLLSNQHPNKQGVGNPIMHRMQNALKQNGTIETVEFLPFWASSLLHCATGRRRTGRQMPDPSPRHGSLRPGLQSRLQ